MYTAYRSETMTLSNLKKKYIGTPAFYKMVILLIIPMIVQQGITNFVNLLDNIMVGRLGTSSMSGVAITNQIIFIYNLAVFGGLAGASIFGAQFFGVRDHDGIRRTMRFKIMFCAAVLVIAFIVLTVFGESLVRLFLENESNAGEEIAVTLGHARSYLRIIIWGLIPFTVVQAYTSTLREYSETVVPMIASMCAIVINLTGNYILIFGHLGIKPMGVAGAALATVISRYIEMCVVVIYTHRKSAKFEFVKGLYKSLYVSKSLALKIIRTGTPLLMNEVLWSVGTTFVNQSYSTRGLTVVAAINIDVTTWQLFCIFMFAMGNAIAILVGQKLGANLIDEAKDTDRKLTFFTVAMNVVVGALIILSSGLIPKLYNTEETVRSYASMFLIISGAALPLQSFIHAAYFTIRSGGKTVITFFFDCVYQWCVPVVLSFVLCRYTSLSIVLIFFIIQFSDILKLFVAVYLLRSGVWAKNIISDRKTA